MLPLHGRVSGRVGEKDMREQSSRLANRPGVVHQPLVLILIPSTALLIESGRIGDIALPGLFACCFVRLSALHADFLSQCD